MNKLLQAENCDLLSAISMVDACQAAMAGLRNEEKFKDFLEEARLDDVELAEDNSRKRRHVPNSV
jgi:hypothetical protein